MNCDKCGKNMDTPGGGYHVGFGINISIEEGVCNETREFYLNQFGKYAKGNKTSYNFCYECLIDAMMGR